MNNLQVTSLYIENPPTGWSAVQVFQNLSKYGEVVDVFLPAKVTKTGKRFGFVRYRNGVDLQRILFDLNRFQVEGGALRANIARDRVQSVWRVTKAQPKGVTIPLERRLEKEHIQIQRLDRILQLKPCRLIREPREYSSVQHLLFQHGVKDATVSQVGGDSVLICFSSPDNMKQFCQYSYDWVKKEFLSLGPWQKRDGAINRTCWITVRGVPLHAWCKEFFTLVAMFVGKLIGVATETENRGRLDYAKLQIVTSLRNPVQKTLSVNITGQQYEVSILESSPCCDLSHPPSILLMDDLLCFDTATPEAMPDDQARGDVQKRKDDIDQRILRNQEALVADSQDPFVLMPIIQKCAAKGKSIARKLDIGDLNSVDLHNSPPTNQQPVLGNNSVVNATFSHASGQSSPRGYMPSGSLSQWAQSVPSKPILVSNSFGPLAEYTESGDHSSTKSSSFSEPVMDNDQSTQGARSVTDSSRPSSSHSLCSSDNDSDVLLQKLALAVKQRRVITRKKPRAKVHAPQDNVMVSGSLSDSDLPLIKLRRHILEKSCNPPVSRTEQEVMETLNLGQALGWDNSKDPQAVKNLTMELIEKEAADWCLSRTDV
ncbi:hypothetical protein Tsubulata_036661 [Turnera subulata]|uniref:RRM domain-containing protein n=1 Tax=Turnera subulata TaxID=218843 RepID=A0A9Q0G8M0_9ROSI|nr:hypothetical protein Tsubulata_036661 [Turnera subulata]